LDGPLFALFADAGLQEHQNAGTRFKGLTRHGKPARRYVDNSNPAPPRLVDFPQSGG
jgi:hypothetical protein